MILIQEMESMSVEVRLVGLGNVIQLNRVMILIDGQR